MNIVHSEIEGKNYSRPKGYMSWNAVFISTVIAIAVANIIHFFGVGLGFFAISYLPRGFVYSFFWNLAMVIYCLWHYNLYW